MVENKNTHVIDEQTLEIYMGAQMGVAHKYNANTYLGGNALIIEKQSASFLDDYVNGTVSLSPQAEQLLPDFFIILKNSSYPPIKKLLDKASKKYKAEIIKRHKEEEKIKAFVATKFCILQNKKAMAKMSSSDMLKIAELLEEEKGYSTKRMKNQIKSFAMLKAERIIKGEIPADEGFVKLVQKFGTPQQKDFIQQHFSSAPAVKEVVSVEAKTKKHDGWFKRKWKAIKRGLVVVGIAAFGIIGGKMALNNAGESTPTGTTAHPDKTEQSITPPKADKPVVAVEETQNAVSQEFLTALDNLNKAYKDRFDSALEIHLGAEKRDQLYQKIDKLAKSGKIQFSNGTTREWYAHAFTMYAQIAPNSEEGRTIARFLAGEDVKPEVLNDLVIKAKRDGTGIRGSGTNSNFDKASKEQQSQHLTNRKKVTNAEKIMNNFKEQKNR